MNCCGVRCRTRARGAEPCLDVPSYVGLEVSPVRLVHELRHHVLPETRKWIARAVGGDLGFGAIALLVVWPRVGGEPGNREMNQRGACAGADMIHHIA